MSSTDENISTKMKLKKIVHKTIQSKSNILVEIVSAYDLKSLDRRVTKFYDVYCVCHLDSEEIHRTKSIKKTVEPIWTIKTDSVFLLQILPSELKSVGGLKFSLLQSGGILRSNACFGYASVPCDTILSATGQRIEFELKQTEFSTKNQMQPKLALRFRNATESDLRFMTHRSASVHDVFLLAMREMDREETYRQKRLSRGLSLQQHRHRKNGNEILKLTKPYPDPNRYEETEFMSIKDIEEECLRPSQQWVEAGSGDLGKIYLEIIKCDNLPNLETVINDVSDPFVSIVFEDALVHTDTINNCLYPRWMPWTRRAFIFSIAYPSSPILIGVFDQDVGEPNDDAIGRVVINPYYFYSNTDYVLTFDLYQEPNIRGKAPQGTLTLRLRYYFENERCKITSKPSPRFLINVTNRKDFTNLRYICRGEINQEKASIATVTESVYEIMSYSNAVLCALDATIQTILWRGEMEFEISSKNTIINILNFFFADGRKLDTTKQSIKVCLWMPIHSIFFFFGGIAVAEELHLLPSFIFFAISWILLTVMFRNSRHPNPWKRTKSITDILRATRGKPPPPNHFTVEPNTEKEKSEDFEEVKRLKIARLSGYFWAILRSLLNYKRKYMISSADDIAIETEDNMWYIFANRLYYLHLPLFYICKMLNYISKVVTWKMPLESFVLLCFFIICGVSFLFIDWPKAITWFLRILFWSLGPWMKIFDNLFVKPCFKTDSQLRETKITSSWFLDKLESLFDTETFRKIRKRALIAHEDAVKLKDMRAYRFGDFSELVPTIPPCPHEDIPRFESYSKPATEIKTGICRKHLGQKLRGTMIQERIP